MQELEQATIKRKTAYLLQVRLENLKFSWFKLCSPGWRVMGDIDSSGAFSCGRDLAFPAGNNGLTTRGLTADVRHDFIFSWFVNMVWREVLC